MHTSVANPSLHSIPPLSPGLRRFLYLTAALNGAAILVVEILGAKILAPYLGTSHFVWTAQITVTLLSLAVGYYIGGGMVDREQDLSRLFKAILVAAVYLCATIPVSGKVAYACLDLGLKLGSFLASGFLYFVPLTLLAMTGPFLIRVLTSSVSGVGGQAGRLSAISTLGSVVGAALIGYVLIPFLPNSVTLLITAALLTGLSLTYLLGFRQRKHGSAMLLGIAAAGLGLGTYSVRADVYARNAQFTELHRCNSNFGILQVIQSTGSNQRFYSNDFLAQNIYDTTTHKSLALFTYMLHDLAHAYVPRIESALCIGMGVGIVPSEFGREGVKVDVVEINEAVVPMAQQFFDLDTNLFQLHIGDGRYFLNRTTRHYDTVILDAFLGDSSPSHLMTREAFTSMKQALTPDGVLVMNCFGYFEYGRDYFVASLEKTLKSVFQSVRIHDSGRGNVFMVAGSRSELTAAPLSDVDHIAPSLQKEARKTFITLVETDPRHGRVLTDDFNPVEYYDAANRELLRRNLAVMMHPK